MIQLCYSAFTFILTFCNAERNLMLKERERGENLIRFARTKMLQMEGIYVLFLAFVLVLPTYFDL